MASIVLQNATLDFPLHQTEHVSAKRALLSALGVSRVAPLKVVRALENITLNIRDGARIGLYGPNGSGKTTLLRMLSGIYPVSSGVVDVKGKVSSLLGIGAGSHPDMSAYENIKMLLRLDGVEPSEENIAKVWEFTDLPNEYLFMPLRTFSSGMLLRTFFSCVTSFPKEIILMDEWLSVADEAFQMKAERRMQDFVQQARILVIASHNPELLKRLCHGIIYLEKGRVIRSEICTPTSNVA